jgi:hypothetical protein
MSDKPTTRHWMLLPLVLLALPAGGCAFAQHDGPGHYTLTVSQTFGGDSNDLYRKARSVCADYQAGPVSTRNVEVDYSTTQTTYVPYQGASTQTYGWRQSGTVLEMGITCPAKYEKEMSAIRKKEEKEAEKRAQKLGRW